MLGYIDFADEANDLFVAPCALRGGAFVAADFSPAMLDTYLGTTDGDTPADMVVAFAISGRVCVEALHVDDVGVATLTDITPALMPAVARRPVLASLDGGAVSCPGLIDSDAGPTALAYWSGSGSAGEPTGHCAFAIGGSHVLPAIPDAPSTSVLLGHLPFSPAVPLGLEPDSLVTSEGVYGLTTTTPQFVPYYTSDRTLSAVVSGTVLLQSLPGAVLIAEGKPDLDVLFREDFGADGFELLRIPTASVVTSATIGDFDSDSFPDIAYVETIGDHERMMIAYGTGSLRRDTPIRSRRSAT